MSDEDKLYYETLIAHHKAHHENLDTLEREIRKQAKIAGIDFLGWNTMSKMAEKTAIQAAEIARLTDELAQRDADTCTWTEDFEGDWETSCGELWQFTDGDPADNSAIYCHHCGKRIAEVKYTESEEECQN
jgi:hypothetical protein